jgi:toxin-antitoxin system PIN domain toxin
MIALDVNILLYALRSDLPQHQDVSDWLESVRADRQPVALFPPVLVGLIRIATNSRIFVNPSPLGAVINFSRALLATPGFQLLPTTERVLALTMALCKQSDAKANLVQDAFLAAHAMEHGCVWITTDRDFSRFPALSWRLPGT